jgi:hypothetical protein
VLLFVLAAAAGTAALWSAHGMALGWDEVDYVAAARLGLAANAMEAGSMSPADFLAYARSKRAPANVAWPDDYDEDRDPLLRRHYHPPFVTYLVAPLAGQSSERALRFAQWLGLVALLGLLSWAHADLGLSSAASAAALLGLGVALGHVLFGYLSFHGWMAVWLLATAIVLARARRSARPGPLVPAVVLALGGLTLPTGVLGWMATATGAVLDRGWREASRWLAGVTVLAVLSLALLWPGLLLKASGAKIAALYAFRLAQGQEYAPASARWSAVLADLWPFAASAVLGLLVLAFRRARPTAALAPYLLVGTIYAAALLPVALVSQYPAPGLAPLLLVAAAGIDTLGSAAHRWSAAVLVAALCAAGWRPYDAPFDRQLRADVAWLGDRLAGRTLYADGAHVYRFHLPAQQASIERVFVSYDEAGLVERHRGGYVTVDPARLAGNLVLVQRHRTRFPTGAFAAAHLAGCPRTERATFLLYDCGAAR